MRPAPSDNRDLSPKHLETISGFLIDWDGCCAIDNRLLPGAVRFLRQNRHRVVIVSNNSTDTPAVFQDLLAREDIKLPTHRIILAGVLAIERAVELNVARVNLLGPISMATYARSAGLKLNDEQADAVILLRDTSLSYDRLESAANDIANGARLIVANPDLTHPGENGRIKPETGALLAALMACCEPFEPAVEIVGKPRSEIFHHALNRLQLPASAVMMIGDNPATDIAGARNVGMRGLLVGNDPNEMLHQLSDRLEAL